MKIGVALPIGNHTGPPLKPYPAIRSFARTAEAVGLDSLWVFDHLLFRGIVDPGGINPPSGVPADRPTEFGSYEAWTILSAIAEATERIGLGTLVLSTAFRNPGLVAKMAATLDELSGGRLTLGLGTGWHEAEFDAFGYPPDHRVGRFAEALEIITALIRTGRADLDGQWHVARQATLIPPARPDLPILVAAKRPRMLALTARFADAWNVVWLARPDQPPEVRAMIEQLDDACRAIGRDPASLGRTAGVSVRFPDLVPDGSRVPNRDRCLSGSVDEIAEGLLAFRTAGFAHLMLWPEPATEAALERLGEAAALVRSTRG